MTDRPGGLGDASKLGWARRARKRAPPPTAPQSSLAGRAVRGQLAGAFPAVPGLVKPARLDLYSASINGFVDSSGS